MENKVLIFDLQSLEKINLKNYPDRKLVAMLEDSSLSEEKIKENLESYQKIINDNNLQAIVIVPNKSQCYLIDKDGLLAAHKRSFSIPYRDSFLKPETGAISIIKFKYAKELRPAPEKLLLIGQESDRAVAEAANIEFFALL